MKIDNPRDLFKILRRKTIPRLRKDEIPNVYPMLDKDCKCDCHTKGMKIKHFVPCCYK